MGDKTRACAARVGVILSLQLLFLGLAACGGGGGNGSNATGDNNVGSGGGGSQAPASDADGDRVADSADCAPNDSNRWRMLDFASVDNDADTFRVNSGGQLCAGENLPANRSATATEAEDCDDGDATKWRALTFAAEDVDGDGYAVNRSGALCGQDTLPAGLFATAPNQRVIDCNDGDASKWRRMGIYRDRDGDGVGSGSPSVECLGATPPSGYTLAGDDPLDDPNDPAAATVSSFALAPALLMPPEETDDDEIVP